MMAISLRCNPATVPASNRCECATVGYPQPLQFHNGTVAPQRHFRCKPTTPASLIVGKKESSWTAPGFLAPDRSPSGGMGGTHGD